MAFQGVVQVVTNSSEKLKPPLLRLNFKPELS
jgi:hypothetical protein